MPDTNVVTPLRPANTPAKKPDPTNQLRQRRHRAKKKAAQAVTPRAPPAPLARAKKPSDQKALLTPLRRANRITSSSFSKFESYQAALSSLYDHV
jgi:hypothetical protein